MIDAEEGVTEQDAKIAGIAHERGKATIIVVNKWDAIEKDDKTIYKFTEKVRNTLSFMPYAELLFVSAKTGQRLPKLFETIDIVSENHAMRVATGVLNEIMAEAVAMQQPPSDKGKRLRLYYITQVAVKPPTFVIFVNDKELMHFSYTRYIRSGRPLVSRGRPSGLSSENERKKINNGTCYLFTHRLCVRPVSDRILLRKGKGNRYP